MEKKTDFKALTTKAKIQYIWDYYRWHIIITILAIAFIISTIHHYATYREPILNVIMINCNDTLEADSSGFDEFSEKYGYDPVEDPIALNASLVFANGDLSSDYTNQQVLSALVAAGDQDLFFGSGDVYLDYANEGALKDLSTVLSAETLEKYQEHLLYVTDEETGKEYPCAIELTDNAWITKNHYYTSCYYGIFVGSPNEEIVKEFSEFLLSY